MTLLPLQRSVSPFSRSSLLMTLMQEDVVVVGRIVLDAESSSGPLKLNEASLVLESSRMMGSGVRIPLRFDPDVKVRKGKQGLRGQGFFPGAIVAVKGKNGGGGSFLVNEILSVSWIEVVFNHLHLQCVGQLPPLESSSSSPTLIKSEAGETEFSMHIACGPFTPDGDLQFRHFQNLVAKVKAAKPDVVLLVCPFPSILTGLCCSPCLQYAIDWPIHRCISSLD